MVLVRGRSDLSIGLTQELGLAVDQIRISLFYDHDPMLVNAGGRRPVDIQAMCWGASVFMNLVHFDRSILDVCVSEGAGGMPAIGQQVRAGARLGNNTPLFSPNGTLNPASSLATTGNHYIRMTLSSPVGQKPWRFWYAYLAQPPVEFPLGAERSMVALRWDAIAYTQDPYNGGAGVGGIPIFDYVADVLGN